MTATTAAGTYSTSPRLLSLNELVNNTRPGISSPLASREKKWNTLDDAPDTPDRNIETSKRSAADMNDSILTEPNSLPLGGKTKKRTKARNHPAANNAIKALSSTPDTSADPQIMTPPDSSPSGARASQRQKSSDPQLGHDYSVNNDWRPWEDDDDPIFPPSTPSPRRSIRAPTSKRHRSKGPSAAREDIDSVSSQFKTLAQRPSDAKGHDRSFEIRRKRHQSLPAQLRGDGNLTGEPPTMPPIRTQPNQDRVLQLEMIDRMKNIESLLKERQVAPSTQQTQHQATATPPNARITAPTHHNEAAATQRRRKKEKTRAERKATDRPEIPRDVPMDLRRSDPFLLKVGKIVNPYERHVEAPYAFAWSGRLYAEYNRLLTEKDEHGGLVFTKEEIRRLTK